MTKRDSNEIVFYVVVTCIVMLLLGMLIGWICPIEGPIDYVYDNYASQPAIKRPTRGVPAPAPKKTEIFEDYNEDGEPEWYQLVPLFDIE